MSEVPRPPDPTRDPENLRRLREEARRRLEQEEVHPPYPAPVYGSPPIPAPVYGGPPVPRLFSTKRLILALLGILVAVAAWIILGGRIPLVNPAPVYGGPPLPVRPPAFILRLPGIGGLLNKLR